MKTILTILILAFSLKLFSSPYFGKIMKFKQPDGTYVDVKLFGDEYYMRAEGLDNYTLVRDKKTGWICYAQLSGDGSELISSGILYSGRSGVISSLKSNLAMPEHIDISENMRVKEISRNKGFLNSNLPNEASIKTIPSPVTGSIKGLCIVVDFSDEPRTVPIEEFTDFCNKSDYNNYGNNGSLRKYYSDISGGLVDYQNVVYGYFRAPLTFAEYDQMPQAQGAPQILGWVLNKLNAEGFDFSTLSTNPDGSIVAINLMYTGAPQNWSQGLWWHQGYYPDFSADGVRSGFYNCSPANAPLILATVAHENGHMIGKWPDTYKYSTENGPDGIGTFDLMCYYGDEYNPVPPNPLYRCDAGWGTVVDITDRVGQVSDAANSLTCYKYQINKGDEFFLMENRKKSGRSAAIADEGLTIWHINRAGDNQTTKHLVYLVHANNNIEDHTQACFHAGFKNEYGYSTIPSSSFYNEDPSGLRLWNISAVSDLMTYNVGGSAGAPALQLSFQSITGDNNRNGFLEPGESGNVNILAGNGGQSNSGNTVVSCTTTGANAGCVSINTPSVSAGVISVSQAVTVTHNVNIAAGTPAGTMFDLRFTISDGTYSTFLTRTFIVGKQILMGDQPNGTCSAIFYDRGGAFSNYGNMTDYTTTISSPSVNLPVKVEFLTFELEADPNCSFDYLKIYDGSSSSAPLLGTFCGTNSPGTITSSDPGGKLTFQFHSDVGWRFAGWSARISCFGTTSTLEENMQETVKIYPNPTTGIINVARNAGSNAEIIITDISGNVVYCLYSSTGTQLTIDLTGKPDGIYLLHLNTKNETLIKKIIIAN